MPNIHDDFRDFLIRKGTYLQRFENGTIQQMVAPYNKAKEEITKRLADLQAKSIGYTREWRIQRLRGQLAEIEGMLYAAGLESGGTLERVLNEFAYSEADTYAEMLRSKMAPVGINIKDLPMRQIDFITQESLIYKYREWTPKDAMLWTNKEAVDLMRFQLTQGIIQGEDMTRIANRLIGPLEKVMGGEVAKKIKNKASIIARSEIQHVSNEVARGVYKENMDVLKGVRFCATLDRRTCPECSVLDGKEYKFSPLEADHSGPMLPLHPFCFIDYQVPIYTSKGFKPIGKIEVGDKVLTHKGRFRKVTDLIRHKIKQPEVVSIWVEYPKLCADRLKKTHRKKITVTKDHPFFVNGRWKAVQDIKKGDYFRYLATGCKRCEKLIPYDKKYCCQSCISKDTTAKQWSDPKHRENMSKKVSKNMLEQYASGRRDPYKTIEKARIKVAELYEQGIHPFQTQDMSGDKNPAKRPEVRKLISESKKGDKNPMRMYPDIAKQVGIKRKEFFKQNPDKHPNRIMAKKGFESSLEKQFRLGLENRELKFEKQFPINGFFVDFAFPEMMIAIEVDGDYWHQDKERDVVRQNEIEAEGWTVLRYSETQVNTELDSCMDEVCRVVNNHTGEYKFMYLKVVAVEHWRLSGRSVSKRGREYIRSTTLYNFSVEDDESYVANGFVSHNCRCCYIPWTKSWQELAKQEGVEFKPLDKQYFKARPLDAITYQKWLQQGETKFMGSLSEAEAIKLKEWLKAKTLTYPKELPYNEALDILGKGRYKLWRQGKLTYTEMVKDKRFLTLRQLEKKVAGKVKPRWKPVMTRVEADRWMKDSEFKKKLYHGTDKGAKVKESGFKDSFIGSNTGNAGMYGEGHYFAFSSRNARFYGGDILECGVNVKNPCSSKRFYELLEEHDFFGLMMKYDTSKAPKMITSILRKEGYDSLLVEGYKGVHEFVVFDAKNIVIIK